MIENKNETNTKMKKSQQLSMKCYDVKEIEKERCRRNENGSQNDYFAENKKHKSIKNNNRK